MPSYRNKTVCVSVKLKSFERITDKCYKAIAFDGSEALIPASCYFGNDLTSSGSDAYWIAEWILKKRDLQYSDKKKAEFRQRLDKPARNTVEYIHHTPSEIAPIDDNSIDSLRI